MKWINSTVLIIAMLLAACSAEKYLDAGQYDMAMERAIKKLNKKPNDYRAMEVLRGAYNKSSQTELDKVNSFGDYPEGADWVEIFYAYQAIVDRQKKIEGLDNLKQVTELKNYEDELEEARENAAAYYYVTATGKMAKAETKSGYQQAYYDLIRLRKVHHSYKDSYSLMNEAQEKGTFHILISVENPKNLPLPPGFFERVMSFNAGSLNKDWLVFHNKYEQGKYYDFTARLEIESYNVTGNKQDKDKYTDEKKVVDKYVTVKDAKGNVVKDENGKPKTRPVYKTISAKVYKTTRSKDAQAKGILYLVDNYEMNTFKQLSISGQHNFYSEAATYKGDKNALSDESKSLVKRKLQSFPSYESMLIEAGQSLGNSMQFHIHLNRNQFTE